MNNENKSLMNPDRVLSLVVLVLAVLMIFSSAFLYYVQAEMTRSGAVISMASNRAVEQIKAERQRVLGAQDENVDGGND